MRNRSRPRSHYPVPGMVALLVLGLITAPALAGGPDPKIAAARQQFFEQEVRPLLAQHCYSCHGPTKQKGGLRLDSRDSVLAGGESGPAIVPGKPDQSLVVEAVNYGGLEMPPTGKLEPNKVAILTRWVALGAPWTAAPRDRTARPAATTLAEARSRFSASDREHWAFRPLIASAVAESRGANLGPLSSDLSDWSKNPIDRFILKALLDKGLTPATEADRRVLIRRATFDLTGLPPTTEEIDAFLTDPAPDAYERLVDRLLASPRYGQHWGRHWLDLVRYAESDGHREDAYRPDAWRYRDYVVRSFNADKPYDRFLGEQLAGDELAPDDLELRVATGFLRLGPYEFNQRNVRGQWADILNDITDVTGEVFLGLSMGCARCHDHKFDPILQKDYYRLQAFFTPLMPRDNLTLVAPAQQANYQKRLAAWEETTAGLRRQIAALEGRDREKAAEGAVAKFPDDIKEMLRKPEKDRTPLEIQLTALAYRQVALEYDKEPALKGADKTRREELREGLKRLEGRKPLAPPAVMAASDVGPVSPPTIIPGVRNQEPIAPGFLSLLDSTAAKIEPPPSSGVPASTGRRMALARWLSRGDNPLSTRVIVNRVWQYHFGRGIVATSSDFGRLGEKPSHPELLDWMANRLVAEGWRLKPLHRLILTSATYRQASERSESEVALGRKADPENRLLWKRTVQRLDAEEIRDAMLATSGELSPALGGPGAAGDHPRRAIDTKVIRNSRDPLLDAFDAPDGYSSAGRRNTTTTPTQALLLINGPWSLARARALAVGLERLAAAGTDRDPRVVRAAYRRAFGREPEPDELFEAMRFLESQAKLAGNGKAPPAREAIVDFCHALLNGNEFLYVD